MERPKEWDEPQFCRTCGCLCERARWCYAIPTCYECLPPPRLKRITRLTPERVARRLGLEVAS